MHRFDYWLVAGGGALGSVARYWLSGVIGRRFGETFPYGTLLVNVSGCLVIGFFATYTGTEGRLQSALLRRSARHQEVQARVHVTPASASARTSDVRS